MRLLNTQMVRIAGVDLINHLHIKEPHSHILTDMIYILFRNPCDLLLWYLGDPWRFQFHNLARLGMFQAFVNETMEFLCTPMRFFRVLPPVV